MFKLISTITARIAARRAERTRLAAEASRIHAYNESIAALASLRMKEARAAMDAAKAEVAASSSPYAWEYARPLIRAYDIAYQEMLIADARTDPRYRARMPKQLRFSPA